MGAALLLVIAILRSCHSLTIHLCDLDAGEENALAALMQSRIGVFYSCDRSGHVKSLELYAKDARIIPRQVCDFPWLVSLSVVGGENSLPSCSCGIASLEHLDLYSFSSESFLPSCGPRDLPSLVFLQFYSVNASIPMDTVCSLFHLEQLHIIESYLFRGSIACVSRLLHLTTIQLTKCGLMLEIPSELCELERLTELDMSQNSLFGPIPPCLGSLKNLTELLLFQNTLSGKIPASLVQLKLLKSLVLYANNLEGPIPPLQGNKIEVLDLSSNNLTGTLPDVIANLSSLRVLSAANNSLSGVLPRFASSSRIQELDLSTNEFYGPLQPTICNLTRLSVLRLSRNYLNSDFSLTPNCFQSITELDLHANQLYGRLPPGLLSLSTLERIDLSMNQFTGSLPALGHNMTGLTSMELSNNWLTGTLEDLRFNEQCNLGVLDLSHNDIGGSIPGYISNCSGLSVLNLNGNSFRGTIPWELGNLVGLRTVMLRGNRLGGELPESLGNLTVLTVLELSENSFTGKLESTGINRLRYLNLLLLRSNAFDGSIPNWIGSFSAFLSGIDLSHNRFSGQLSRDIDMTGLGIIPLPRLPLPLLGLPMVNDVLINLKGQLRRYDSMPYQISFLDLSSNFLEGELPDSFGNMQRLMYLTLSGNRFSGKIPASFGRLSVLEGLDLTRNTLSDSIPETLVNLTKLGYFNVSYNNLSGTVPSKGQFSTFGCDSYIGNKYLNLPCSQVLESGLVQRKMVIGWHRGLILGLIGVAIGCVVLLVGFAFLYYYKWKVRTPEAAGEQKLCSISSSMRKSELWTATQGFDAKNIIGTGASSTVYKGRLARDGKCVAIKVFRPRKDDWNSATEIEALSRIKHRNLVRFLGVCWEDDCKALVFDLMPNGTLDSHLHDVSEKVKVFTMKQRLKVALGVAYAVRYLHHELNAGEAIVHGDLKPSNIFLDDEMEAHVGDFGAARLLQAVNAYEDSKSELRGSLGYMPPELAVSNKLCAKTDVYSYGIILLEMLTGKRPTNSMFKDGSTLHDWARSSFPNLEILLDPTLLSQEEPLEFPVARELFRLGILCSSEQREHRPTMDFVTSMLAQISSLGN
ncbi:LRR receptor-like serine/threonine-protein kinase GSO1 [Selaginella moellendorffii]|uniref:LRR receptor-like serine/threonine-protein kinase GSO1 n=1 Tax=Selaginella moellendorffii TaxID=88036 RepID=UPI000D1CB56B|nr:LRR receptor-like serine/threonine-protein kinase GSO1 [Selaginella moellendorffii]|eukprot:XP_024545094.1 LRR receptor-like serine/threonine-protein kinase GSO1 [Selaginella moellendorffii]